MTQESHTVDTITHPLNFSYQYPPPHISVYRGSSYTGIDRNTFTSANHNLYGEPIAVKARILQLAWAETIACSMDINRHQHFFISALGDDKIDHQLKFELLEELNQAHLLLDPQLFLLTQRGTQDTALSQAGLKLLSQEFARTHAIPCLAFTSLENLTENYSQIKDEIERHNQLAILATLEPSKRHVTGFFAKKNQDQIDIYVFDTTGITLPAWPCGEGYKQGIFSHLVEQLNFFHQQGLHIHVMPISSVRTLQVDRYSCLIATLLFFEAMLSGEFSALKDLSLIAAYIDRHYISNGSTSSDWVFSSQWGIRFPISLFTVHSLPLLVGIQDKLSLMLIINDLPEVDTIYPELASLRNNWKRKREENHIDGFWQYAYFTLLHWLGNNDKYQFPNFKHLVTQGLDPKIELIPLVQEDISVTPEIAPIPRVQEDISVTPEIAPIARIKEIFSAWNQTKKTKNSSLIHLLATINLSQDDASQLVWKMASQRQHRNASKFNSLWFAGRDTCIVQPLYDEIVRRGHDFKFDQDFLDFLHQLDPKLDASSDINQINASVFLQSFATSMEKNLRGSTGMRSLVKLIQVESKNIDIEKIQAYMRKIAVERCQRTCSKLSFFGKGRDTEIIQPLYDLMAKPDFKLNQNGIDHLQKVLNKLQPKPDLVA